MGLCLWMNRSTCYFSHNYFSSVYRTLSHGECVPTHLTQLYKLMHTWVLGEFEHRMGNFIALRIMNTRYSFIGPFSIKKHLHSLQSDDK